MKLHETAFLIIVLKLSSCAPRPIQGEYNSYYQDKRYQYKISVAQLARSPIWDRQEEPNPPYPAANALRKAETFMATIPAPKNEFWTLDVLALEELEQDRWAWRATYRLGGIVRGNAPTMQCWILMDGTLLKPKITSYALQH